MHIAGKWIKNVTGEEKKHWRNRFERKPNGSLITNMASLFNRAYKSEMSF
jgi:hypothetical protein